MEILEVGSVEYAGVINAPFFIFGSSAFNDLNRSKCDELFFLLFKEGKYRLGIAGGVKENSFLSPFSAPFGGFVFISDDIRLQYIDEALKLLVQWAEKKGFFSISITLPPSIYGSSFVSKQLNCIIRSGFAVSSMDLNYSLYLEDFDEKYQDRIWYNARKNLRISLNSGLEFAKCNNDEEKMAAYEVIRQNRESNGFPLRMTWQQVAETAGIISADFFLVKSSQVSIASAIVFHVSETVVQVIYWGELKGYSEMKPMNFTSYKVFEYYKTAGKKVVDIGPSSENSFPNFGLCEFKESIGCRIDPKYKLVKKFG
jgi:hypothetical protein